MSERRSALTKDLINSGRSPMVRQGTHGPIRLMATAEGYVMARRPNCVPFVLSESDWLALPAVER